MKILHKQKSKSTDCMIVYEIFDKLVQTLVLSGSKTRICLFLIGVG